MHTPILNGLRAFRWTAALPLSLPLLLPLLLALSLLPTLSTTARAACDDATSDGQNINCDEDRTDGWSHGGNDGLTVSVEEGVTLTNIVPIGTIDPVMELNDIDASSSLTNLGTIQADADDQNGIQVGDHSVVHNSTELVDEGDLDDPDDDIYVDGVINVNGDGVTDINAGIKANDRNDITNSGTINVNGSNSAGIRANSNNTFTGFLVDEFGVLDPENSSSGNILNQGTIEVIGTDSYGIKANNNNYIENGSNGQAGIINVSDDDSYGIYVEGAPPPPQEELDDDGNKLLPIDYGNTVRNSSTGLIEVTGDGAIGIHFEDRNGTPEIVGTEGDDTNVLLREQGFGGIKNDGVINVNAVTGNQAAALDGGSHNTIVNNGIISVEAGGDAIRVKDDNYILNEPGLDEFGDPTAEETGVIDVEGDGDGIVFAGDDLSDDPPDDRGNELNNQGRITTQGGTAVSFAEPSGVNKNIVTNGGTIESDNTAIQGSPGIESIFNNGIITGNVNLEAGNDEFYYQYLELLDEDENPIFQSRIDDSVDLGIGDDLFSLGTTPTGINGVIYGGDGGGGDDTLELRGTGEFDLSEVNGGGTWRDFDNFNVGRDGDFVWLGESIETRVGYSPVTGTSDAGTWVLSNTGNVGTSIPNFNFITGSLQAAGPNVRVAVQGSTTFGNKSIYISALSNTDDAADDDDSTWFSFSGAPVVLEQGDPDTVDGAELKLTFVDDEAVSLAPGNSSVYTVLESAAGFDGTFTGFTHPDTPVFNFAIITEIVGGQYDDNFIQVEVTRNLYEDLGSNHNQRKIGHQLDVIQADADNLPADWEKIFVAINSQDLKGVQSSYDQLSPEAYDAHTSLALSSGLLFTRGLLERPLDCKRRTHHSLENRLTSRAVCGESRWEPWFIGFGQHQKRDSDTLEFEGNVTGAMTGVSKRFTDDFSMSFGIGAATGDAELDTTQGRADYDGAFAGLAAALDVGPWRYKSAATYSYGSHDMKHRIAFTVPNYLNKSDNTSNGGTVLVEASYGMLSENGWEIRPSVGIDYAYLKEDSLKEKEVATGYLLNLNLDERKNSVAAGSIGLHFSKSTPRYRYIITDSMTDGIWTSDFSVRARGVFTGYERDLESSFQGAPGIPVEVTTDDSRIMGEFGAGITFQPRDSNSSLGLEYHAAVGDEGNSQSIQGNYRMGLDQKSIVSKLEPLFFGRQYKYGFAKY